MDIKAILGVTLIALFGASPTEAACAAAGGPIPSARKLTGMSYAQGLAACRVALSRFPCKANGPAPQLSPMDMSWDPAGPHKATRLYRLLLAGEVRRYLDYRLYLAFIHRYRPKMRPFINRKNLAIAAAAQARIDVRFSRLMQTGLENGWSYPRFETRFHRAFPMAATPFWSRAQWAQICAYKDAVLAVEGFDARGGGPGGWQRLGPYNALGNIAIWAVMNRRRGY